MPDLPRLARGRLCVSPANSFQLGIAFERLDPALQRRLENSFAWHEYAYSRGKIAPDLAGPAERAALPPQCWRLVWKNPVNGRKAL